MYTDSSYSMLIFGATGVKYQKKGYKNVKNKDLVEQAVGLAETTDLHFVHVSAHTGAGRCVYFDWIPPLMEASRCHLAVMQYTYTSRG